MKPILSKKDLFDLGYRGIGHGEFSRPVSGESVQFIIGIDDGVPRGLAMRGGK